MQVHPAHQRYRAAGLIIGMLWIVCLGVSLQLNYFPDITSSTATFTVGAMSTSINAVTFCNRQYLELVLFMAKNLYAAVVYPDCYVLVKADMAIEELSERDMLARKKSACSSIGTGVGKDRGVGNRNSFTTFKVWRRLSFTSRRINTTTW